MAENLKVTKYNNGDAIPNITDNTEWANLTTGAYSDFNNDPSISETHGKLYNSWVAADSRSICMEGWSVPTYNEYSDFLTSLNPNAGGKLKEIGTSHWKSPNTDATNETGFTAIAMGYRQENIGEWRYGISGDDAEYAYFWTSEYGWNYYNGDVGFYLKLYYSNGDYAIMTEKRQLGASVRCLKD